MLYVENDNIYPPYNFGVEQYFINNTDEEVFMLWRDVPCVIIGKNQDAYAEVNLDYARDHHINVYRRLSGGGAVYHDLNNIEYTYISSKVDVKGTESFKLFAEPIVESLKALGLKAEFTGRNDILLEGGKISGNAQHRQKDRILHHGTLLVETDKETISNVLYSRPIKFQNKKVKSVSSRVGAIKDHVDMDVKEFMTYLKNYVIDYYNIKDSDVIDSTKLDWEKVLAYAEQFKHDSWNLGEDYKKDHVAFSVKYPYGLVEYRLRTKDNKIDSLYIQGDYFEDKDVEKLADALIGTGLDEESLDKALSSYDISDYINGMDKETLISDLLKMKEDK